MSHQPPKQEKKKAPADAKGKEGDQAAEETCRGHGPLDPPLILARRHNLHGSFGAGVSVRAEAAGNAHRPLHGNARSPMQRIGAAKV